MISYHFNAVCCFVNKCTKYIKIINLSETDYFSLVKRLTVRTQLGSRVVSALDSGAEGPGFKSQSRRCRVTVLGKLFTPIVPLFTKQQNL